MKQFLAILLFILTLSADVVAPGSQAETDSVFLLENFEGMTQQELSEKVLRLHVVANSDTPQDQQIKLDVRDRLIARFNRQLTAQSGLNEAVQYAKQNCEAIQAEAQACLEEAGADYGCTVEVTTCPFPEKRYGELVFPPGDYQAVRVILGNGDGQNWWCVLYPPLCFLNVRTEDGISPLAQEAESQPVEVRWKLLEWLKGKDLMIP